MFAYGDMQICSVKFNALERVWNDMTRSNIKDLKKRMFFLKGLN